MPKSALATLDHIRTLMPPHDLIDIADNDYLGIAHDNALRDEFLRNLPDTPLFGATGSRLISGNHSAHIALENSLVRLFSKVGVHKNALVFNSGYHANVGTLTTLCQITPTAIICDKLAHASIIEGAQHATLFLRYRHNDIAHLQAQIAKVPKDMPIIVASESVFSMDGDCANLQALVALKHADPRIRLYIDEAHGFGVFGEHGTGLCQAMGVLDTIDYYIGAFGKAVGSVGGFVLSDDNTRTWLINRARPFIYSTALPPINALWSAFIIDKFPDFADRRRRVLHLARTLWQAMGRTPDFICPIVPIIDSADGVRALGDKLRAHGFFAKAIYAPTVPANAPRVRISLSSRLDNTSMARLCAVLQKNTPNFTRTQHYQTHAHAQHAISARLALLARTHCPHPDKTLALGAGRGDCLAHLSQFCTAIDACDIALTPNLPTHGARLTQIDAQVFLTQHRANLIFAANVVQWFDNPFAWLTDAYHALHTDGYLVFNVLLPLHYHEFRHATGIGLPLHSIATWQAHIMRYFSICHSEAFCRSDFFATPIALLRHIQATGVRTGQMPANPKTLMRTLCQRYPRHTPLAPHPSNDRQFYRHAFAPYHQGAGLALSFISQLFVCKKERHAPCTDF